MAYELEDISEKLKRVDPARLQEHERRSIQDIRRIYEKGLYRERDMLAEHISYLQGLIKRCMEAVRAEQAEGYDNAELKKAASEVMALYRRLAELATKGQAVKAG